MLQVEQEVDWPLATLNLDRLTANHRGQRCQPLLPVEKQPRAWCRGSSAASTANSCNGTVSSVSHSRIAPEDSRDTASPADRARESTADIASLHLGQAQFAPLDHADEFFNARFVSSHPLPFAMALWSETAEPWGDGTTSSGSCPRSRLLHLDRRGRPWRRSHHPTPRRRVCPPSLTAGYGRLVVQLANVPTLNLDHPARCWTGVKNQPRRRERWPASGGSGYLLMELVTDGRPLLIGGLDGAQRRHFRFARHRHEFCSPVGIPALARMPLIASVMSPLVTVRSPSRSAVARSIDVSEATRAFIFSTASDMTLRT